MRLQRVGDRAVLGESFLSMAGTDSRVSHYQKKRPTTGEGCRGDSVNRHSRNSRSCCRGSRCLEQNNMRAQMLLLANKLEVSMLEWLGAVEHT